jgi:hypothetical protein
MNALTYIKKGVMLLPLCGRSITSCWIPFAMPNSVKRKLSILVLLTTFEVNSG